MISFVKIRCFALLLMVIFEHVHSDIDVCDIYDSDCTKDRLTLSRQGNTKKYLLYDVNAGEGFNLRRDVYMRIASLVRQVHEKNSKTAWNLVLPSWGPLYHWKSSDVGSQKQLEWSLFFDISSLNEYVPVIEFNTFINENGPEIGELYYLQHYAEFFMNGHWEERFNIEDCLEETFYHKSTDGKVYGWFWGYNEVYAKNFHCLSIQGTSSTLRPILQNSNYRSIMIDRAEVILHDAFGSLDYWKVRKSMKYAKHLIEIGNAFRIKYLNSSDDEDGTTNYWSSNSQETGPTLGGPYLGIHLRRQDFIKARPSDVPSIVHAVYQIKKALVQLKLTAVFIATDAPTSEFEELKKYLPSAVQYKPNKEMKQKIKDGGISIVEQWICAHARHFIGTHESTFSFRIQEEREILGFHPDSTFNRFCGDNQTYCKQPSRWTIVNS